jgi:16S rRNA (guanine1516-N2)-methyltransferase
MRSKHFSRASRGLSDGNRCAVFCEQNRCERIKSERLSRCLSMPLCTSLEQLDGFDCYFMLADQGLCFGQVSSSISPISVNFAQGKNAHRRLYGGGLGQSIAKAVGLSDRRDLQVVDATAGLGADAFVLASLGARVTLIERHPFVSLLLSDGLQRGLVDASIQPIIERMHGKFGDALIWLESILEPSEVDVVYLDPMFPESRKKAQVKREMQVFRHFVGQDLDADSLLAAALSVAKYRVVVKRPRHAPDLAQKAPTYRIEGKSNRFDIYVKQTLKRKD